MRCDGQVVGVVVPRFVARLGVNDGACAAPHSITTA
jgi:hypothetical protein